MRPPLRRLSRVAVGMACAALAGLLPHMASAQTARVEIHPFKTLTLTDQQFLTGAKQGGEVVIAGELRLPESSVARLPTVVLIHGSGGIGRNAHDWVQVLNGMGFATFLVDSFSARGLVSVSANQALLGRLVQTYDAYRALELIAKHPRVDPARIAAMGFSRGGQAILYASMKRFQGMHGPANAEFAAYIPFYANCATSYIDDENLADRPIRLFHGSDDDYVPVAPCRAYVERLRKAGKDVMLTEYAGAYHVFDGANFKTPVKAEQSQSTRACRLAEESEGRIINADTKQPFTMDDPCVVRGPTIAYNAEAHSASVKAVTAFLRATLKLE
ncbi:MAG: dienelactone hydrolase family protein [Hyphomicrobiaceae bacterium]|nr:dienelactone hydrolase family protein [Hyphomicrobiaceae bacterium]